MKKYFGSLLVATSLTLMAFGTVGFTGCSSNTGVIDGAPGEEEPEEVLSDEEEAGEEEMGTEEYDEGGDEDDDA